MDPVGGYELEQEVGRGATGAVYRARDPRLGRTVALKLLLAGRQASPAQRQRFQREVQALSRLRHPHVVGLLDGGEHQGAPYLVLEWVEGETLSTRLLREGPLPLEEAVRLAAQLADGLAHAHAAGVLHRDLKPDNVLLRQGGREAVLTDFGLTRDLDPAADQSLSRTGQFMGTPGYWPPEQARGQLERLGPWSDVYGLGATLHAALTGSPPHGEPSSLMDAMACLERDPPPPSAARREVPRELDAIVARSLARDPAERFPDAAALRAALEGWLAGRRAPGRSPAAAALAAGIVLLGGVGWAALLRQDPPPAAPASSPAPAPSRLAAPEPSPPSPEEEARAALREAWRLSEGGDPAAAMAAFDRAVGLAPTLAEVWLGRGTCRAELGQLRDALADCDRAVELAPNQAMAWCLRGSVRLELKDAAGALADFDHALELDPHLVVALDDRADVRASQGELVGAAADLSRALELEPTATRYDRRGLLAMQLGQVAEALADFDRALALNPALVDCLLHRGAVYEGLRQLDRAEAEYRRGLELDPYHADGWTFLGNALALREDSEGAIAAYTKAIALDPELTQPRLNRGVAHKNRGELREALADYSRVLELDPTHLDALLYRAVVRVGLGDVAWAITDYERALALAPDAEWAAEVRQRVAELRRR